MCCGHASLARKAASGRRHDAPRTWGKRLRQSVRRGPRALSARRLSIDSQTDAIPLASYFALPESTPRCAGLRYRRQPCVGLGCSEPALRRRAAQRDLPAQAARSGAGSPGRCPPLQPVLFGVLAPGAAGAGAVLRAPVPCGAAVPDGERAGAGRRRAAADDHAALGGAGRDAEALAAPGATAASTANSGRAAPRSTIRASASCG